MKKLLFLIALLPASLFAWEHPKNPDRFPSIGLSYAGSTLEGEYVIEGFKQDTEVKTGLLLLDTRLPLSNKLTLDVGIGSTAIRETSEENRNFFGEREDLKGAYTRIGIRYYFSK